MRAIDRHFLIKPDDLTRKVANPMKVPCADLMEHTQSDEGVAWPPPEDR